MEGAVWPRQEFPTAAVVGEPLPRELQSLEREREEWAAVVASRSILVESDAAQKFGCRQACFELSLSIVKLVKGI